ncbi:hypothetical protein BJ912DRAFT_1062798 [Pholiota molesta]|nr:hypothetical protein BJ912DRAFT_1062798 [Pholiota molesta]
MHNSPLQPSTVPKRANDDGIGILATDKACVLHIVYPAKAKPQSMGASVTTRMATRQIASTKDEACHVDDDEQKGEGQDGVVVEVGGTPARRSIFFVNGGLLQHPQSHPNPPSSA